MNQHSSVIFKNPTPGCHYYAFLWVLSLESNSSELCTRFYHQGCMVVWQILETIYLLNSYNLYSNMWSSVYVYKSQELCVKKSWHILNLEDDVKICTEAVEDFYGCQFINSFSFRNQSIENFRNKSFSSHHSTLKIQNLNLHRKMHICMWCIHAIFFLSAGWWRPL